MGSSDEAYEARLVATVVAVVAMIMAVAPVPVTLLLAFRQMAIISALDVVFSRPLPIVHVLLRLRALIIAVIRIVIPVRAASSEQGNRQYGPRKPTFSTNRIEKAWFPPVQLNTGAGRSLRSSNSELLSSCQYARVSPDRA